MGGDNLPIMIMQMVRRRIRKYFGIQAVLSLAILAGVVMNPRHVPVASPVRLFAILAVLLLLAMLFGTAYWTTRKLSPYRNPLAVAASALSCAEGAALLYFFGSHRASLTTMVVMTVAGAAGVYLYSQGGAAPKVGGGKPLVAVTPPVAVALVAPISGSRQSFDRNGELRGAASSGVRRAVMLDDKADWDPVRIIREGVSKERPAGWAN